MSYIIHLSKDKKLKKVLDSQGPQQLKKRSNICLELCSCIMSQQLSTKVAAVIYDRFIKLVGTKNPTATHILSLTHEQLRSIGLSNSKVTYMHNVARFAVEKGMDAGKLKKMNSEEIINYLTTIKGVGKWTAEMILMFTLAHEDVFSADDLGIQNAMEKLYKLDKSDKKKFREEIISISGRWSPYRTYACLHLWQWKDKPDMKLKKKISSKKSIKKTGINSGN